MWKNFQEDIFIKSGRRLEVLKQQEKYITTPPYDLSGDKIMPKIEINKLADITVPDLNYNAMKEKLSNEDEFFSKTWSIPKADDQRISDAVIKYVIKDEYHKNTKEIIPSAAYNWCKTYPSLKDQLNRDISILSKGVSNAEKISKSVANSESALDSTLKTYFMEFNGPEAPKSETDNKEKSDNAPADVTVYFKVCNQVCRAKLTIIQRIFNEYTAYLLWHVNKRREEAGIEKIGWNDPAKK